ncbi:polysaccharide deacetylase family protein [Paenibacillus sp. MMS20-IR301]|uniref:polysaccharide deacetylase family protein n=1 Tax=Paenibacillus sp. MMS20-IR301 TaxID=2895946 RepID=UPI0028E81D99|nr:polysaccharide deacetylase family protein [Paenibacillus sp. MMS20-IR301]WNS45026.1 polysaccharide deacetylase family protein [Paenibacillus sp. MMS20-IR301]
MKLTGIRRILLLVLTIVVIMPDVHPAAGSASASASLQTALSIQSYLLPQPDEAADDEAIPAGSGTSSSAVQRRKKNKSLSLSQLLRKYPDTIKTQGPRSKSIALTFDDVPDPRFTPELLDVLHKYHVKATFFVVGSRAEKHPDLVARMIREGHVIGNHSYNHPEFSKLSMNEFRTQIIRTENILQLMAGYKPRLIRPPYGDINEPQLRWARAHGYKLVNWNVDSLDWRGLSKTQVRNNILARAGKGAIILQHGGGGKGSNLQGTIQALPEIISIMRKRGYSFVTVPQMFQVSKSK